MIKVIDKSENKIYDNNKHLIDKFAEFSTENLGFDKPVTVYFSDDQENAKNPLGQTAHYNPDTMEIHILVTDRHIKDVLRSVSHELIHHVQNCRGDLEQVSDTEAGYAQRDDHMRDKEHQAYTSGNIMNFRDFEDKFKSEKPIMNENHFKKNRLEALHKLLMEEAKASAAIRAEREAKAAAPEEKEEGTDYFQNLINLYLTKQIGKQQLAQLAEKGGTGWKKKLIETALRYGRGVGGPALAILIGAAIGTYIGYEINSAIYADFDGEAKERIKKAFKDPKYGLAELELYCRGTGSLCSDNGGPTRCAKRVPVIGRDKKTGKRTKKYKVKKTMGGFAVGGYQYERASGLGVGAGREKETDVGKWVGKSTKKMQQTLGDKAGAAISAFSQLPSITAMAAPLAKSMGDAVYTQTSGEFDVKDIAVIAGITSALLSTDITAGRLEYEGDKLALTSASPLKPYEACIKGLLTSGIAKETLGKFPWLKDNFSVVSAAFGLHSFADLQKMARAKGKGSGAGPTKKGKCDNFPVTPGCTGKTVKSLIGIITQATKIGQKAWKEDQSGITDMYNKAVYTPEVGKLIQAALQELDPKVAKDFADKGGVLETAKDPAAILIDRTALERSVKENKEPESLQGKRLLELNKRLMKGLK